MSAEEAGATARHVGWLIKKGGETKKLRKNWLTKWVVLTDGALLLYPGPKAVEADEKIVLVASTSCSAVTEKGKATPVTFLVKMVFRDKQSSWLFRTDSTDELEGWVHSVSKETQNVYLRGESGIHSSSSSDPHGSTPTDEPLDLDELERKLRGNTIDLWGWLSSQDKEPQKISAAEALKKSQRFLKQLPEVAERATSNPHNVDAKNELDQLLDKLQSIVDQIDETTGESPQAEAAMARAKVIITKLRPVKAVDENPCTDAVGADVSWSKFETSGGEKVGRRILMGSIRRHCEDAGATAGTPGLVRIERSWSIGNSALGAEHKITQRRLLMGSTRGGDDQDRTGESVSSDVEGSVDAVEGSVVDGSSDSDASSVVASGGSVDVRGSVDAAGSSVDADRGSLDAATTFEDDIRRRVGPAETKNEESARGRVGTDYNALPAMRGTSKIGRSSPGAQAQGDQELNTAPSSDISDEELPAISTSSIALSETLEVTETMGGRSPKSDSVLTEYGALPKLRATNHFGESPAEKEERKEDVDSTEPTSPQSDAFADGERKGSVWSRPGSEIGDRQARVSLLGSSRSVSCNDSDVPEISRDDKALRKIEENRRKREAREQARAKRRLEYYRRKAEVESAQRELTDILGLSPCDV